MKTKLERIRYDIDELAKISVTQGPGCCRQTYTKEFAEARDYIVRVMKEIGLSVREDAVGNIFGRMEGKNPEAPVIMTGSHFDTVRTGGRFDGLAGVVAALEVARVMKEEGFVPNCPIEFVATAEEEGTRFSGGLFGSRAMCGQLYENELEKSLDMDGISMAQAMREYGLDPEKVNEAILNPEKVRMFLELHIEQGPVLDAENIEIGIVDAIAGLRRWVVTVKGRSDHSGSTPMNMRADTMLAAARALVRGTAKTAELGDGTMVTCGSVEVKPGAMNVVANDGRIMSYLLNHIVNEQIARVAQGKSVVHVQASEVGKISITYPDHNEQERIAQILELIDNRIAASESTLNSMQEMKKALLQQLFI